MDRDDSHSEILELESIPFAPSKPIFAAQQSIMGSSLAIEATSTALPIDGQQKLNIPTIVQSIKLSSTGEVFDVTAELDLLLRSLEQATPHPPKICNPISVTVLPENLQGLERRQQESLSISETVAAIAVTEVAMDTQLHQELNNIHQQLVTARTELQSLHQRNQSQVDAVAANAPPSQSPEKFALNSWLTTPKIGLAKFRN